MPPGRGSHRFLLTRRTWGALTAATTLAISLAIPATSFADSSTGCDFAPNGTTQSCSPPLAPSTFEGGDGNLVPNTGGNTDWSTVQGLNKGIDLASGSGDNAFGQGTKEDDPNVSVVSGSIPPQKSDLTRFYEASEFVGGPGGGNFLYMGWERTNNLGSVNMDFEINQATTPNLGSPGAHTINRTAGDLLVTFDFTNGGGATADAGGTVTYTVYSDNTCSTQMADAGTKTVTNGNVPDSDPVTFNDASTFFWQAVYSGDASNNCATSDCTSEKLLVKAKPSIATSLSDSTVSVGDSVHDSATLTGATADAGGTVTYTIYNDNTCNTQVADGGTKTVTNGNVPDSDPVTFNNAGTFFWQAVYSGDANNNGATSDCTSEKLGREAERPGDQHRPARHPQRRRHHQRRHLERGRHNHLQPVRPG
jgi:hypothetical protein